MSSIFPILISNKDKECTENRVRNIILRSFLHIDDIEVTLVWHDPFEARRAVALVDFKSQENVSQNHVAGQKSYQVVWADPATSLLVNTNGIASLSYGITDKLKMLFTMKKRGGSPVQFVKPWKALHMSDNNMNFFEVVFSNGWDAVLEASSRNWTVGGEKLTALPLFSCFQEDLDTQFLRFSHSEKCINAPRIWDAEESMDLEEKNSHLSRRQTYEGGENKSVITGDKLANSQILALESLQGITENTIQKPVLPMREKELSRVKPGFGLSSKNIECPNHFLGWLLSEVEYDSDCVILVNFDQEKGVLHVQTEDQNQEAWYAAMTNESYQNQEMPDYEELFLIDMKSLIKLSFSGYKLDLDVEGPHLVINKTEHLENGQNDGQETLQTWIASLVEKRSIPNIPNEWFEDDSAYRDVKELHKDVRFVSCKGEKSLILLALSWDNDAKNSLTSGATDIKNLLILSRKFLKSKAKKAEVEDQETATVPQLTHAIEKQSSHVGDEENFFHSRNVIPHKKIFDSELNLLETLSSRVQTISQTDQIFTANNTKGKTQRQFSESASGFEGKDSSKVELVFGLSNKNTKTQQDHSQYSFSKEPAYHEEISKHAPSLARDILAQISPSGPLSKPEIESQPHLMAGVLEINCSNLFLGWLLCEVEYESSFRIQINFDQDKGVLRVQTEDKNKEDWWAAMAKESVHIQEMLEYEEKFLMEMRSIIKLSLLDFKLALSIENQQLILTNTEIMEIEPGNDQITLQVWIASLIEKECFSNIPNDWLEDDTAYREIKEFHKGVRFVSCKNEKSLVLLTLSWDNDAKKSLTKASSDVKNLLILVRKFSKSQVKAEEVEAHGKMGTAPRFIHAKEKQPTHPVEKVDSFMKLQLKSVDFLSKFLKGELKAIESKYPPLQIKVENNGLRLHNSYKVDEVKRDLLSLQRQIKRLQQPFVFPGLALFLRTEGQFMLDDISEQFQCLIFCPGRDSEASQDFVGSLQLTDSCYHGILIGTAKRGSRSIHLVQGEPKNMKVDMIVDVYASTEGYEATLEADSSSARLILSLPEWSCQTGLDCHKLFEMQRQRLKEKLTIVFQHAHHFRHRKVAICTTGMRKAGLANFPIEDFAETVGWALWTADVIEILEIYVCDSSSSLVFKAFDYLFAKQRAAFRLSDERDWEVIKSEETSFVPDYNSLQKNRQISVKVSKPSWTSYQPQFTHEDVLCVPVTIHLDHVSIPFIGHDDQQDLQRSVFSKFPDGLLPGQVEFFTVRSRKKFLVYCCSPWGFDAEKTLGDALTSCFHKVASHKKINFVPPLGYPDHYVAPKIFQCLDSFIESIQNYTQITIWVENDSQQKTFYSELKKRKPEQRGYLGRIMSSVSSFLPEGKEKNGPSEGAKVIRTQTPKIEIGFLSLHDKTNFEASNALYSNLSDLIKQNTHALKLNQREIPDITSFEIMVKNNPNISAELKYKTLYKSKRKGKNRKNKPQGFENILLTVSALTEDVFAEFIHQLKITFGLEKISETRHLGESYKSSKSLHVEMGTGDNNIDQTAMQSTQSFQVLENSKRSENDMQAEANRDRESCRKSSFTHTKSEGTPVDDNSRSENVVGLPVKKFEPEHTDDDTIDSKKYDSEMHFEPSNKEYQSGKACSQSPLYSIEIEKSETNMHQRVQGESGISGKLKEHCRETEKSPKSKEQHVLNESLQTTGLETAKGEHAFMKTGVENVNSSSKLDDDIGPTVSSSQLGPKGACNDSQKANLDDCSMDWENVDPLAMSSPNFVWFKLEARSAQDSSVINLCSRKLTQILERAYLEGKTGILKIDKEDVDLDHMTAKSKDHETQLFRMEVFDTPCLEAIECPQHWCQKDFRTVDVDCNNGNYKTISQSLQSGLKSYEVKILKIEALENPNLYRKYRCKQKQSPDMKDAVMWHRISSGCKLLACHYGLHYHFMDIPIESRPGSGAVCCFFKEPECCFSENDTKEGVAVCLVRAVVLVHKSVSYHAISSDAQAYPMHFCTVRVKKR